MGDTHVCHRIPKRGTLGSRCAHHLLLQFPRKLPEVVIDGPCAKMRSFCLSFASVTLLEAAGVLSFGITSLVSHLLRITKTSPSRALEHLCFNHAVPSTDGHLSRICPQKQTWSIQNTEQDKVPGATCVCVCLCKGKLGLMTTFCREKHVKALSCD